jgi:uncharacterized protein
MNDTKKVETIPLLKNKTCPNCSKPADLKYRPFCSKRCADLDLGQWLNESYKIESNEQVPTEWDEED